MIDDSYTAHASPWPTHAWWVPVARRRSFALAGAIACLACTILWYLYATPVASTGLLPSVEQTLQRSHVKLPTVRADRVDRTLMDLANYRFASASEATHAIRVWDLVSRTADSAGLSQASERIKSYNQWLLMNLSNNNLLQAETGSDQPLFFRSPEGVGVRQVPVGPARTPSSRFGESHYGQTIYSMAEAGLYPDHMISVDAHRATLNDVLNDMEFNCTADTNQQFGIVVLAAYRPESLNHYPEDLVLRSLLQRDQGGTWCYGTHRPKWALDLLQINRRHRVLSRAATRKFQLAIRQTVAQLASSQHDDGAWRIDWSESQRLQRGSRSDHLLSEDWGNALLVTSHHLEWLAMLDDNDLVSLDIAAAWRFMDRGIAAADVHDFRTNYVKWSHVIRAWYLWQLKTNQRFD